MQHPSFVLTPARLAVALAAACCTAPSFAAGKDCEQLRSEVVRRYEAGGIASPEIQLDGSCELGTKKLVYAGAKGASAPASSLVSAKPPDARAPVLTECKDGTVSMGGSCKGR
jgi:hypothetical protein